MNQSRRMLFLKNFLLLSLSGLMLRALAVAFNGWVNGKIGAECMGLFTLTMSVYGFAVTLALASVNLAAVRLTSQRCAMLEGCDKGSWKYAMRQVRISCCLYALIFSSAAAVLLWISAPPVAELLLDDSRTVASLRVLAVSLPPIALSSALSGCFTGLRKGGKNTVVAVSEQLAKIAVTSTALILILPGTVEQACLAVVGGSAAAEAWSFLWNAVLTLTDSGKPAGVRYGDRSVPIKTTLRDAAEIALPTAVGACARQGLTTLEHLAIPKGLGKSGLSREGALSAYGLLQGIAFPLTMFPYAVIGAFTSLLIPEMAELFQKKDVAGIREMTRRVYHIAALFSVGACGIFACFPGELGRMVYRSADALTYTRLLGLLVPFMYLDTAVDALLKGLGEQVYTMKVNMADSAAGLILVILLTPVMGMDGYILCIWICELGNLWASIRRLGRITGVGIRDALSAYAAPVTVCLLTALFRFTCMGNLPAPLAMGVFCAVYLLGCILAKKEKRNLLEASSV